MADRTATSIVYLITRRLIPDGVAWAVIPEGRRASVVRKADLTWQYMLDGVTYDGFAGDQEAIIALSDRLAAEEILLRVQGL